MDDGAGRTFLLYARGKKSMKLAKDAERRLQMHLLHRVPLRVGELVQRGVPDIAGVVYQDMDIAERVQRGGDEAGGEAGVRHTTGMGDRLAAGVPDRANSRFGRFGGEGVDDDARALLREFLHEAQSDAASAARHKGDLSREAGQGANSTRSTGATASSAQRKGMVKPSRAASNRWRVLVSGLFP